MQIKPRKQPLRVLVLTLFSGEQELGINRISVQEQVGCEIKQVIISNLPNVEAHENLYRMIMANAEHFDVFVKLDADMCFCSPTSLKKICTYFCDSPDLDHYHAPVFDHPSNSYFMGFHVFSNRVTWNLPLDALFPDPFPKIYGRQYVERTLPIPLIDHMQNPSLEQGYMLGFHRALKITQKGRTRKSSSRSFQQLRFINKIWRCFLSKQDVTRACIIIGFADGMSTISGKLIKKDLSQIGNILGREEMGLVIQANNLGRVYFSPQSLPYWNVRVRYIVFVAALNVVDNVLRRISPQHNSS